MGPYRSVIIKVIIIALAVSLIYSGLTGMDLFNSRSLFELLPLSALGLGQVTESVI
jgi:hypothetical protein